MWIGVPESAVQNWGEPRARRGGVQVRDLEEVNTCANHLQDPTRLAKCGGHCFAESLRVARESRFLMVSWESTSKGVEQPFP